MTLDAFGRDIIYQLPNTETVIFNVGHGYKMCSLFTFYLQLDASEQVAQLIKHQYFVLIISIEKEQSLSSIMTGDTSSLLMQPFIYEGAIKHLLNDELQIFDLKDENGNHVTNEYWQQKLTPLLCKNGMGIICILNTCKFIYKYM